jgi:plasmid stabilization system protein ParE
MPRGDKSAYTDKQKRQAEHIEESELDQGRSREAAERIAWATVNKQDGGGKKTGSGRKTAKKAAKKATKKTAKTATTKKTAARKATKKAAKKASRS